MECRGYGRVWAAVSLANGLLNRLFEEPKDCVPLPCGKEPGRHPSRGIGIFTPE
jgi:hypothetical protein